ncbi:hypothetical protein ACIBEJ_34785 [Nonomuraea sp. NPDC050790]|uniref:hypothetical protein n=1 Tax=Nonomuraea sp. NPDC050790 TaxID=3364371 RepID=UPI0037B69694
MAEIRRFRLHRVEDVSGVSGTGVVAEGVVFSDDWAVTHWLDRPPMHEPTMTTWLNRGHDGIRKVHGHNGATRVEWLDIPMPPAPDYSSAWTELRGYVEEAVRDGKGIDAADMLAYLDELKRRAFAPGRDWIAKIIGPTGETPQ